MMGGANMKWISPALLLSLGGCFACATGSHVQPVSEEMKVYRPSAPPLADRHTSSRLEGIAPGTWVRYRLARNGSEITFTIGAVRVEPGALWIEVVEEGDPKKVSLRRVTFDGQVTSARFREIPESGPPSEIVDQPVSPAGAADERGEPARVAREEATVRVGTRDVSSKVIRALYRDEAVGREYETSEAWSSKAPALMESSDDGGLIFRRTPTLALELKDWGEGYAPLLPP
jgi:hypothetical protein